MLCRSYSLGIILQTFQIKIWLQLLWFTDHSICPIGCDCGIHWLLLYRGERPLPNECSGYDTKQSDGEVSVILELWGMQIAPSSPSLPGPLWPSVVAPDMGHIYGSDRSKLCTYVILNCWNRTVLTLNSV